MPTETSAGVELGQETYDAKYQFVWVFMSVLSAESSRGAPSAIFSTLDAAEKWISEHKMTGNLYRFPLDISLTDYSEPINGGRPFIKKYSDKKSDRYLAGIDYLGLIPHRHYGGLDADG